MSESNEKTPWASEEYQKLCEDGARLYRYAAMLLDAAERATEEYVSYLTSGEGERRFISSMDNLRDVVKKIRGVE